MIRHVVAFKFKPETPAETVAAVLAEVESFPSKYPQMRSFVLGPNISLRDTRMSHVFTIEFDDEDDLKSYLNSETHETFVRETWRPVIDSQTIVTLAASSPFRSESVLPENNRPRGPYGIQFARLATPALDEAVEFYTYLVGLQVEARTAEYAQLRAGIEHHSIELVSDPSLTQFQPLAIGLSVESEQVLDDLEKRLRAEGAEILPLHERTASIVTRGFATKDPNGLTLEFGYEFLEYAEPPMLEYRPLDLVHPFLSTDKYEESLHFYLNVLGFQASDYVMTPGRGTSAFIRSEDRYHHSVALRRDNTFFLAHLCFRMKSLDHVMRGRAKALYKNVEIASDIVNHSASTSIAFYLYDERFGPRIELCDGHRVFTPEEHETHKARRMGGDPRNIDVWRAAADDWERF
ncbi:Dabb family protein [Cryptosporangium sp. NPDC048952]|uniref:Dabb family protein n=1 Tax=Cryptosporangium sp. NPDC048952 TaxID=3363961 RepID=UPI0037173CC2